MVKHHFISYSPAEALKFATRLCDALGAGPPPINVWLDKRELQPGQDWDVQIAKAISTCESLLFVMTRDSVEDASVCKAEWTRGLRYKKPVIPLKLESDAELPFRIGNRQYIDFTGPFEPALARLRTHLAWLASPAGVLQALEDRLADARRDLVRANDASQSARINADIAELEQQIGDQGRVVEDPKAADEIVTARIARGLENERQFRAPAAKAAGAKFINPPPLVAPTHFQDRRDETGLLGGFLRDGAVRLITVVGRAGIGKTAMVCRLLKASEGGQSPDDGGPLSVDGIVYLNARGLHLLTVPNLYADLGSLLPDETASQLEALCKNARVSTEAKIQALLAAFPIGRTVVLLDAFEDVIDPGTLTIRNAELGDALQALLNAPQHAVKVILTTRIPPRDLALVQPGRQAWLYLDEGLPTPYAENILRAMDADGKLGLKVAPAELLAQARERTRGYPRAIEALFAILSADRDTSLRDVLTDPALLLPANVVEALAGEAYSRLDPMAQQVTQALAVYGRPVPPAAVDYLLQPHLVGISSAPALSRLVNMQFARKEAGRYYLHPVDRAYAFGRMPRGVAPNRGEADVAAYTQLSLLRRAAAYFRQVRTPRETWRTIEDLAPHLAEFELLYAGEEYDVAVSVLLEIDRDYLLNWGFCRLMADMHERLQGKLTDPALKMDSAANLGNAYYDMGQYQQSITRFGQAILTARQGHERLKEGRYLGSLALCYARLGQTDRALMHLEQALAIAHEVGDRSGAGHHLGSLGLLSYDALGQTGRAISYFEQALTIAREPGGDRAVEGRHLGSLGLCYARLGQADRAMEHLRQALGIAREVGDRSAEGHHLGSLANLLIDEERYDEAVQCAVDSVGIAEQVGSAIIGSYSNRYLALARLYAGDLPAARAAAAAGLRHDETQNSASLLALLGVIALRQGDRPAAREAFHAAMARADELLASRSNDHSALDSKGLALSGLAVCEGAAHLSAALEAYRAARALNQDAGMVGRVRRLLDALMLADVEKRLVGVRSAAAGE